MSQYSLPLQGENEPALICQRLVQACEELSDLHEYEPRIEFLMRHQPKVESGRHVLGTCHLPTVQGKLKGVFEWMLDMVFDAMPDYLIVLDLEWWDQASPEQREILVFHELCHTGIKRNAEGEQSFNDETGEPNWGIVGHDIEEFNAVVARYGAYDSAVSEFVSAVSHGNSVTNGYVTTSA